MLVRESARFGHARKTFEREMETISDQVAALGISEVQFLGLVAYCKRQSGMVYRNWLDREIKAKANYADAYALMANLMGNVSRDDLRSFEDDLVFYDVDGESLRWAVHRAVTTVIRPAKKHSDLR